MLYFILFCLCFIFSSAMLMRRQLHMLQLNAYLPGDHLRWAAKDLDGLCRRLPAAAAVIALLVRAWYPMAAALLLCAAGLSLPKKAKKPLVYTKRVRRMILALALIYALCLILAGLLPGARLYLCALLSLSVFLSPLAAVGANLLMSPIERSINRGFIDEAGNIIASSPSLLVIGVTGSYGKTSMKFFLGKLLEAKYEVLVTPESYNTTLGVVRTIREKLRPTHEVFVCEMGAKKLGEIKEICDIVHPRMGIITSIGPQHLESFGSLGNVIKTKFELEDALPEDGTVFLNADNEYIAEHPRLRRAVTYGLGEGRDYRAEVLGVSEKGTEFAMCLGGERLTFTTSLLGTHNVQNLAGAVAAASELGVSPADIARQLRKITPVPHRLELRGAGSRLIIDDAFNSNPAGAKAALDVLSQFTGAKILVTPGMIELGERQYELNFAFGQQSAKVCDYAALVGERQTRPIYDGLVASGFPKEKIFVRQSLAAALEAADAAPAPGRRVILLENDLPDNY